MATNSDPIPEEIDFSNLQPPVLEEQWPAHLAIAFTLVVLFRLARAFGVVNWCHRWIVFLCSVATAKGRAQRAERYKLATELIELRAKLKSINMMDQFAQHSRCERRIKVLERQLSETRPETFGTSVIRVLVINILFFALEGVLSAWLITRTPSKTVDERSLEDAELRGSYFLPFLYGVQYVPAKLIMLVWLGLCHSAARPITAWLSSLSSVSTNTRDTEQDTCVDETRG